jgi:hypothetical protein
VPEKQTGVWVGVGTGTEEETGGMAPAARNRLSRKAKKLFKRETHPSKKLSD